MNASIKELDLMTESERRYRIWERIEEMNLTNPIEPAKQWQSVLAAKWAMAANYGGNH